MSNNAAIVLGLAAVGAYFILNKDVSTADKKASPTTPTNQVNLADAKVSPDNAPLSEIQAAIKNGNVAVTPNGYIKYDVLNEAGKPRMSQEAQIYNIQLREGVNTAMAVNYNNNPLDVAYQTGSGGVFVSTRSAANSQEAEAARVANIRSIERMGGYTAEQAAEKIAGGS